MHQRNRSLDCRTQWRNALERKSDWFRLIELSKYHNFVVAFYLSHSIVFGHAKKENQKEKTSKIDWIHYSTLHSSEMAETLWHSGISSIYCSASEENRRNKKLTEMKRLNFSFSRFSVIQGQRLRAREIKCKYKIRSQLATVRFSSVQIEPDKFRLKKQYP